MAIILLTPVLPGLLPATPLDNIHFVLAIKSHLKGSYDEQNLTLMVISDDIYESRRTWYMYDSDILRQDYGIIRCLIGHHQSAKLVWLRYPSSKLWNHTRYADGSYEVCRLGHQLGSKFTGTDRNGRS